MNFGSAGQRKTKNFLTSHSAITSRFPKQEISSITEKKTTRPKDTMDYGLRNAKIFGKR
jgi:hypothetical protein